MAKNRYRYDEEFTRELPCRLTEDEILAKGKNLAQYINEKNKVELEKSLSNQGYKTQLEVITKFIHDTSRDMRNGTEDRRVKCQWRYDFHESVKELVRNDTMEVIDRAKLTDDDRQLVLMEASNGE